MDKNTRDVMFSSKKIDHTTPPDFFLQLNDEFNFTMDVAADDCNFLVQDYLTEEKSAFDNAWGLRSFCNPPYGRGIIKWVDRATLQYARGHAEVIAMLVPARTDTKWFHKAMEYATCVRLIKGRLKFGDTNNSAPFPSALIIWAPKPFLIHNQINENPYSWITLEKLYY